MNFRYLKRLFELQRRQYRRQTLCEHCLSRSRRADEQDVVPARTRHFEGTFRCLLAANFREIDLIFRLASMHLVDVEFYRLYPRVALRIEIDDEFGRLTQIFDRINIYALHDRRFAGVFLGYDQILDTVFTCRKGDRQRPANRPYTSVKRQFANAHRTREARPGVNIAIRTEYSKRDRQVKTRTFFAHIRRSQIDHRLIDRKKIPAIRNRRPYPLTRFAYRRIRQPDNCYRRRSVILARRAQINLDVHDQSIDPINRRRLRQKKHRWIFSFSI